VRVWVSVSALLWQASRPRMHPGLGVWLSDWWCFPDAAHRGCVTQDKSGEASGGPLPCFAWLSMAASGGPSVKRPLVG
jgi:hypothetical protein